MNDAFSIQSSSSYSELNDFSNLNANPVTQAKHRREVFWQITFPFALMCIILITFVVLICIPGQTSTALWKDISIIFLILLVIPFIFVFLLLLGAITYGVIKLIIVIPPYANLVQGVFRLIKQKALYYADKSVEPILQVNSWKASSQILTKNLIKNKKNNKK
jgi:hypothetical protein